MDMHMDDPRDITERELEQRRFDDERALINTLRENPFVGATAVHRVYIRLGALGKANAVVYTDEYDIAQFAEEYGWPAVYRVLATAIHEYEDARRRG